MCWKNASLTWKVALERRDGPTMLVLTRQKLPVLDRARYPGVENLARGGYVLADSPGAKVLLLATGSEVHTALDAADRLAAAGVPARVVSMPSWELFEAQPASYRDAVLPPALTARVAVEAGVGLGWERYTGRRGAFVGMTGFGASAPADRLFKEFGITPEKVVEAAQEALR